MVGEADLVIGASASLVMAAREAQGLGMFVQDR
jgi:hypothetical protein